MTRSRRLTVLVAAAVVVAMGGGWFYWSSGKRAPAQVEPLATVPAAAARPLPPVCEQSVTVAWTSSDEIMLSGTSARPQVRRLAGTLHTVGIAGPATGDRLLSLQLALTADEGSAGAPMPPAGALLYARQDETGRIVGYYGSPDVAPAVWDVVKAVAARWQFVRGEPDHAGGYQVVEPDATGLALHRYQRDGSTAYNTEKLRYVQVWNGRARPVISSSAARATVSPAGLLAALPRPDAAAC